MTPKAQPIAITGVAAISCLGSSLAEHESAYSTKTSGITKTHPYYDSVQAPLGLISNRWIESALLTQPRFKSLTRLQQISCILIEDIFTQHRVAERFLPHKIGLSISTTSAGLESWLARVAGFGDGWDRSDPKIWFQDEDHGGTLVEIILKNFPIAGPDFTFSTACSGGGLAIAHGVDLIQRGDVDACIVGGIDVLSSLTVHGFHSLQVMDSDFCKPFSNERAGMNLSEGGAFFLLEKSPTTTPLGFIAGYGAATDFFHMTQPDPSGMPMKTSMQRAIGAAGWTDEQITYINAHGTGTLANDAAEQKAIDALECKSKDFRFESTKNLHGHCLAGAGALELLVTLIATKNNSSPVYALSNSFGFGGHNLSLAILRQDYTASNKLSPSQACSTSIETKSQFAFHASASIGPRSTNRSTHPLWRRMTWTSKALLDAKAQFESLHHCDLKNIAKSSRTCVYYGTMFGEMEAGLIVAEGIIYPGAIVSPTAFQQSVHNAPLAYFMQTLEMDVPTVTITSGEGSLDRALWMASQDLLFGRCDVAIVLNACEYHLPNDDKTNKAHAEICVLTTDKSKFHSKPKWTLDSMSWDLYEGTKPAAKLYCEPLTLDKQTESFSRKIYCGAGRQLTSNWKQSRSQQIPAEKLIPHRGPMLLVDFLEERRSDGTGRVFSTLRANQFVFDNGIFINHWLVEILAQAVGLVFRSEKLPDETQTASPSVGYLLSIDDFNVKGTQHLRVGDRLSIEVVPEVIVHPLGKFTAVAFDQAGDEVGRASMKFFSGNDAFDGPQENDMRWLAREVRP